MLTTNSSGNGGRARGCAGRLAAGDRAAGYRLGYVSLDIFELLPSFPDFAVALVVLDNLSIRPRGSAQLEALVSTVEAEVAATLEATPANELAEVQAWRSAYRACCRR